jgi:hypothetical protein
MALGEAAGQAAAMSVERGAPVGALDGVAVRERLEGSGGGAFTEAGARRPWRRSSAVSR